MVSQSQKSVKMTVQEKKEKLKCLSSMGEPVEVRTAASKTPKPTRRSRGREAEYP